MDKSLFERATGALGPNVFAKLETTKLVRSFRPAPHFRFDGGHKGSATTDSTARGISRSAPANHEQGQDLWAHQAGVNALALERFDGRILISGGSDATIKLWDLEQCGNPHNAHTYKPIATIHRSDSTAKAHKFGITHLSIFPSDPGAFLSSSYDQTLKIWDTSTVLMSGTWDMGSKIYTHAISPIAQHLLVACGTAHPAVRLVDLRSNAAVQTLVPPGQISGGGAVLSLAWSPRHEHVLASGTLDGAVRIWDVRRASALLGLLDQEDSLGIFSRGGGGRPHSHSPWDRGVRVSAKAHAGPVNGLTWTDDGAYIVSAGHDRRIRVWDAATSANTLASFGPSIRNGQLASVPMFVTPVGLTPAKKELLFWPNETEILVMDLHEGTIVTRLRAPGSQIAGVRTTGRAGERSVRNRITGLVWRGAGACEGSGSSGIVAGGTNAAGGVYSGRTDGQIHAWMPRLPGHDGEDAMDDVSEESRQGQASKRKALDGAFKSLMGTQVTWT
ncbi:WD40 repeat-like protein [Cryphonectria parasitica EP155]|uniref:WD40 repeat-like protein n=1 Tax=Cryphonectria parasitica (strain ATCC 38755 / EP155) TaxID=660469 RepID=A0A9P5CK48_CRYP1|nr:WD40 repeat-like protein [Cryphonectria parasitica EP155]KAF3760802.1 WD40 repeat-like protein [Cryphonectria parasitica EP155]